jgi:two-component system alkaline phosphatase synthesis response regulator PhoP
MTRVVLAEDDQTMVRLLSTLLRMEGFDVQAVSEGEDVEAALERHTPEVLVLDMVLPKQNGLEVLERIRRTAVGSRLYVLMISGLDVRDLCLSRGADDFLLKPFMPEELTRRLQRHHPNSI